MDRVGRPPRPGNWDAVVIALDGHESDGGDEPARPARPSLVLAGTATVGAIALAAMWLLLVDGSSGRDAGDSEEPAASPASGTTEITTPPTLDHLEQLPPTEIPVAAAARPDPTAAPPPATAPRYDVIDESDFPDVDLAAAIADLDARRSRRTTITVIAQYDTSTFEVASDLTTDRDLIRFTRGSVLDETRLLVDRMDGVVYLQRGRWSKWARSPIEEFETSEDQPLAERIELVLGGPLRGVHPGQTQSVAGPVVATPEGEARLFQVTVERDALKASSVAVIGGVAPGTVRAGTTSLTAFVGADGRLVALTELIELPETERPAAAVRGSGASTVAFEYRFSDLPRPLDRPTPINVVDMP